MPIVKESNSIPEFHLNFYLMGKEESDESTILQIGENIDYLNQEFEGAVRFKLNRLFIDVNHAYIPDLHISASRNKSRDIDNLVNHLEEVGAINIYLFETYSEDDSGRAMMGFTPILSDKQELYQSQSPRYDRLFIAYPGLSDKSTIVHEMGHFLGLSHPWDMNSIDRELMGLSDHVNVKFNHMSYNPDVSEFTVEQLTRMQHFALNFRKYLLCCQKHSSTSQYDQP